MTSDIRPLTVFSVSDSTGQTAETLSKAAVRQFRQLREMRQITLSRINTEAKVIKLIPLLAQEQPCIIAYTLSIPTLKDVLDRETAKYNIPTINLLDPLIKTLSEVVGSCPYNENGILPELDEEYFRRIEAVEFAIRFDDGKEPKGLEKADIVLVGVSRTSKTPTCMYLAQNYGMKVANIPLVYNIKPPRELFGLPPGKIIGLRVGEEVLHQIRMARLQSLGLTPDSSYADLEQIRQELDYAANIMHALKCPIVDVSLKAVEETAGEIMLIRSPTKITTGST